jgi:hypothetical protein
MERSPGRSHVCFGSWLCENAKTLNRDRRSYSSKTVLALKLAGVLNSENELKNVILATFRFFEFLHSQGQISTELGCPLDVRSTPIATKLRTSREVRFVPITDLSRWASRQNAFGTVVYPWYNNF